MDQQNSCKTLIRVHSINYASHALQLSLSTILLHVAVLLQIRDNCTAAKYYNIIVPVQPTCSFSFVVMVKKLHRSGTVFV